jgi:hypothetical protein
LTKRDITISAEIMRRWVHKVGWVWKRTNLVAKDNDPHRMERLARIQFVHERLWLREAMVFADALDIDCLHRWRRPIPPRRTNAFVRLSAPRPEI